MNRTPHTPHPEFTDYLPQPTVSPHNYVLADNFSPSIFQCFIDPQALTELEHTFSLEYSEETGFVLDAIGLSQMRVLLLSVAPVRIRTLDLLIRRSP